MDILELSATRSFSFSDLARPLGSIGELRDERLMMLMGVTDRVLKGLDLKTRRPQSRTGDADFHGGWMGCSRSKIGWVRRAA